MPINFWLIEDLHIKRGSLIHLLHGQILERQQGKDTGLEIRETQVYQLHCTSLDKYLTYLGTTIFNRERMIPIIIIKLNEIINLEKNSSDICKCQHLFYNGPLKKVREQIYQATVTSVAVGSIYVMKILTLSYNPPAPLPPPPSPCNPHIHTIQYSILRHWAETLQTKCLLCQQLPFRLC